MRPLRIAILWHQHQPYYKSETDFILPWVRLHGIKDYYDLAELLHSFPRIKQTFNVVPAMISQIDEYTDGLADDTVRRLARIEAESLTDADKAAILERFFIANEENMIHPYPRYNELKTAASAPGFDFRSFSAQDWRDLQVWYSLAWIGPLSRRRPELNRFFEKGRGFTEIEKQILFENEDEILSGIVPLMKRLAQLGQAEISVSPYYHPILPLLIDTESAREAMPGLRLRAGLFARPEDAQEQIGRASTLYAAKFGSAPTGMWPSEGSVSDAALAMIAKNGFKWVATDEEILLRSTAEGLNPLRKFFPWRYRNAETEISMLFRDHSLSDAIGFIYSRWKPFDAACDFTNRLRYIRSEIVHHYGESALEQAVVPIILDGENCWEFYQGNGLPFLAELYKQLSSDEFHTITCSEATQTILPENELGHVRAGSWINANFSIWIGQAEDQAAWEMLAAARDLFEKKKNEIKDKKLLGEAMEELLIAEGSDWCWWYGDEHSAPNKPDFDVLFRFHIRRVYELLGEAAPDEVNRPIGKKVAQEVLSAPSEPIRPSIAEYREAEWSDAGCFRARGAMSAMHQIGEFLSEVRYGFDSDKAYFHFVLSEPLGQAKSIRIDFGELSVEFSGESVNCKYLGSSNLSIESAGGEHPRFSVSKSAIADPDGRVSFEIVTRSESGEIRYPQSGALQIKIS